MEYTRDTDASSRVPISESYRSMKSINAAGFLFLMVVFCVAGYFLGRWNRLPPEIETIIEYVDREIVPQDTTPSPPPDIVKIYLKSPPIVDTLYIPVPGKTVFVGLVSGEPIVLSRNRAELTIWDIDSSRFVTKTWYVNPKPWRFEVGAYHDHYFTGPERDVVGLFGSVGYRRNGYLVQLRPKASTLGLSLGFSVSKVW